MENYFWTQFSILFFTQDKVILFNHFIKNLNRPQFYCDNHVLSPLLFATPFVICLPLSLFVGTETGFECKKASMRHLKDSSAA